MQRQHPVYIAEKAFYSIFAFVTALLLLIMSGMDTKGIVMALYADAGLVIYTVCTVILQRLFSKWKIGEDFASVQDGVFYRKNIHIGKESIVSVKMERDPLLSLFKCVKIRLLTKDDKRKITLRLPREEGENVIKSIYILSAMPVTFSPSAGSVLLSAFSGSGFINGLIVFIPALIRFRKITGIDLSEKVIRQLKDLFDFLPEAMMILICFIAGGWLTNFVSNCLQLGNFTLSCGKRMVTVMSGAVSRKLVSVNRNGITAVFEKKSLLLLMLKRAIVTVGVCGHGEITVTPAAKKEDAEHIIDTIAPMGRKGICTYVDENGRTGRWMPWAILVVLILLLMVKTYISFSFLFPLFAWCGGLTLLLLLYKLILSSLCAEKAYLEFDGRYVIVCTEKGMKMLRCIFFADKIACIRITQNVFQQVRNLCSVKIRAQGSRKNIKCKNLSADMMQAITDRIK